MVKSILLFILVTIPGVLKAQENETRYISEGLIRATATFAPGLMTRNTTNGYIHGFCEYFFDDRVSVRGDGSYLLFSNSRTEETAHGVDLQHPLLMNHSIFAGCSYHFNKHENLDLFAGIQPGLSVSKYNETLMGSDGNPVQGNASFNPVYSLLGGATWYAGKYFHFFGEFRYINGIHMANGYTKYLDEFRLSFGLGFDIRVKK